MDYFKKLKDSVSSVLPVGNPVFTEFEVHNHRASSGPGLMWKVYDGSNKSTKQEATVFICEKKSLDKLSKSDRDKILETLKRGVSQLTKLRHPNLLSVLHPLEESRESIAFATEPVFASLANVLGRHDNMPVPVPDFMKDFELFDVEIKYGLFQVCEGLAFLHNSVKLVHANLCAESIMLNKSGAWKIAGFDFCNPNANASEQSPYYHCPEWNLDCPHITQPNMDYLAPEYIMSNHCDTNSDMFSVGVLFHAIYNKGKTVFECRNELTVYRRNITDLKKRNLLAILGSVPAEVRDYVKLLLNTEASVRPDADQLSKLPFFEDMGSMTLQYVDSLFQRDNLQKSQFFKGLPKIIEKLPKRINVFRILPPIFKECVNKDMVPFILPCVLLIADQCSQEEYVKHVLPGLKPLIAMKEPVQILLVLLQNMNLLLSKTPPGEIKLYVLPMVYDAVETNNPQIQELCMNILPTFASLIDYPAMKNSLIPRIKRVCLGATLLNVRVNCLVCIGKLLEYMDKWYVLDEIIPILQSIPSREPAVLMSMLGIYQVALTHSKLGITKDILATRVIPHLFPLVIDNNLNLPQFNAYMKVLRDMIERVESEQRGKLKQLHSIQQEQKTLPVSGDSKTDTSASDSMMDKVLGGFGLATYLAAGGDKSSPVSVRRNSNPSLSAAPSPLDTKLPNQPAKVSLTLQEKQKLAKQQELQQQFKSQSPLHASSVTAKQNQSEPVRDLTSTLMDSNMMGSSGMNGRSNAPLLNTSSPVNTLNMAQVGSTNSGGMLGSGGKAYQSLGPISTTTNVNRGSPNFDSGLHNKSSANSHAQKPNYSAFDSLVTSPSSKQPTSVGSMGRSPAPSVGQTRYMQPSGVMPNTQQIRQQNQLGHMQMNQSASFPNGNGMMGNMQMNQQRMMGQINMNQPRMNMHFQPVMGNMNAGQSAFGGSSMLQPSTTSNNMTSSQGQGKKLSSQELADFLG